MFRLLSKILNEKQIQISVEYNDMIISTKFITLELNGDDTPTFANSRLKYSEICIEDFVECMRKNDSSMFMFDYDEEEEIFDGFLYHNGSNAEECFIIKTAYGSQTMSCNIPLKDCKDTIIGNLLILKDNIKELYDERIKYIHHISKNDDESDDEKTTNA